MRLADAATGRSGVIVRGAIFGGLVGVALLLVAAMNRENGIAVLGEPLAFVALFLLLIGGSLFPSHQTSGMPMVPVSLQGAVIFSYVAFVVVFAGIGASCGMWFKYLRGHRRSTDPS